jgi:hypothetical protein
VHLVVASAIAAISAAGIDHDGAAGGSGRGIVVDGSALEFEAAVHRVECAFQGEFHLRFRRVQRDRRLFRKHLPAEEREQGEGEPASHDNPSIKILEGFLFSVCHPGSLLCV